MSLRINDRNPGEMRFTRRQMNTFLLVKFGLLTAGTGYLGCDVLTNKDEEKPKMQKEEKLVPKWIKVSGLATLTAFIPYAIYRHLKQGRLAFRGEGETTPPPSLISQEQKYPQA
jgi:uncharacterized membrane protein YebE (DUF533 family)